ncbi:MAG: PAS domain-containing protein, partial [Jaaginema sp. PMC 1078.18]|nr:PAS domain-containing protein [Jaaginema sp. PMC 1078.18]
PDTPITTLQTILCQQAPERPIIVVDRPSHSLNAIAPQDFLNALATALNAPENDLLQQKLQSSEQEIRNFFEAMTDIVLLLDAELSEIQIAPTQAADFYAPPIDIIGLTIEQFFNDTTAPVFTAQINTALATQTVVDFEYCLTIPETQQKIWFTATISPTSDHTVTWVSRNITDRKQQEEALQLVVRGTGSQTGEDFFHSCVYYLAKVLNVRYALVTRWADPTHTQIKTLAFWASKNWLPEQRYSIENTPCEQVLKGKERFYIDRVQECFPQDCDLAQLEVQSYLGIPLFNKAGDAIGHIAILDTAPMADDLYKNSILRIFAARAAAELERQLAREALQTSMAQYRNLVETANCIILRWNTQGEIQFINDYGRQLLGYERESLLGQPLVGTILTPISQAGEDLAARLTDLCQHPENYSQYENEHRTSYGQILWIAWSNRPIYDEKGNLVEILSVGTDVTARQQAEATLREKEQYLRLILDNIPQQVFWKDTHSVFQGCNSNWAKSIGLGNPDEIIGKTDEDLLHNPDDAVLYRRQDQEVLESGQPLLHYIEIKRRSRSTQPTWLDVSKIPILDNQNQPLGLIGVIEDISDRKLAEETLNRQFQRTLLLDTITQQIRSSLDSERIFRTTAIQVGQMFRVSRCTIHSYEALPKPHLPLVSEYLESGQTSMQELDIRVNESQSLQTVLTQDRAFVVRDVDSEPGLVVWQPLCQQYGIKSLLLIRTSYQNEPNGAIALQQCDRPRIWTEDEIELIEAVAAQVGIALAQARLLEQEKHASASLSQQNEQLAQAKQQAEEANRVKSQFLANMSHELRTPLNAILGFSQILSRDASLNDEQREYLQIINSSGEHLLSLIDDILDMSKIEAGQTQLNLNAFDLFYLLDNVTAMMQLKAAAKGIELNLDYPPTLPRYLYGDEGKLRQVLINLLSNGIKFTQAGFVSLSVVTAPSQTHQGCGLQFQVQDTGLGIAPAEQELLFKPFVQTRTGRNAESGTGLGLTISRHFVQLMGGEIWLESQVGQGTTFTFEIAVELAPESPSQPLTTARQAIAIAPERTDYRILVVEDRWESRHLLVQFLKSLGFNVREADNGVEAIAVWEAWQPHLIWMDMRMPVMDGYEATKRIKSHLQGQDTTIIALTASAFEEEKTAVLGAGCDDFARKPWREETILGKMTQYLGVRYIYNEIEPDTVANVPQTWQWQDIQAQLSSLDPTWIAQLHKAAMVADSEWLDRLITEIPSSLTTLRQVLSELTHNFRCDRIMELTQPLVI